MEIGISELVALIAITSATIYVLGLVALGYPVYSRITQNSSTALYVVSVAPRTVVAGHGVRFLLGIPLIWTLLFAASLSVPELVYKAIDVDFKNNLILGRAIPAVLHELPVIVSIAIVLLLLGVHEVLRAAGLYNIFYPYSSFENGERAASSRSDSTAKAQEGVEVASISSFLAPSLIIANIVGCAGGVAGGLILATGEWSGEAITKSLVVIIMLNFMANVLAVLSIKPPMPKVKITRDDTNGSKEVTGYLLAHSEGLWYIFDDEYTALQTIRDDKARIDVLYP
jgi:hypothetical protein